MAVEVLAEFGLTRRASGRLAKRSEEIFCPIACTLSRCRAAAKGCSARRVRDEAHRFAITSHRQRRQRWPASLRTPGIGPQRRKALLKAFDRDIEAIRAASIEELTAVPGITREIAENLKAALGG